MRTRTSLALPHCEKNLWRRRSFGVEHRPLLSTHCDDKIFKEFCLVSELSWMTDVPIVAPLQSKPFIATRCDDLIRTDWLRLFWIRRPFCLGRWVVQEYSFSAAIPALVLSVVVSNKPHTLISCYQTRCKQQVDCLWLDLWLLISLSPFSFSPEPNISHALFLKY